MSDVKISGILAMDLDEGIGKDGGMPWHIPEDFKHFKKFTEGKTCVMGSKTFEDIISYKKHLKGPVLPNRICVVLTSREEEYLATELTQVFFHNPPSLNAFEHFLKSGFFGNDICIVGGASLFNHFAGRYDELSITTIHDHFDCDRFVNKDNITSGMSGICGETLDDKNYLVKVEIWSR